MAGPFAGLGSEPRLRAAVVQLQRHRGHRRPRRPAQLVSPQRAFRPRQGITMLVNEVQRAPDTQQARNKNRSMWPLYAILLMALAPVIAAVLAYFMPQLGLRPEGHNTYGRILDPQRPIPSALALPLTTLDVTAFDLTSLRGQWVLVTADSAAC